MVNARQVDETLELLTNYFPHSVGYAQGFERMDHRNDELAAQAVALAKEADCVLLYLGLPEGFETEGLDRSHMRLPNNQEIMLNKLAEIIPISSLCFPAVAQWKCPGSISARHWYTAAWAGKRQPAPCCRY